MVEARSACANAIRLTPSSEARRNSLAFASIQDVIAGIGWSAVGRIVFEAAIVRGIVRRRNHDAIGEPRLSFMVVAQHRMGNGWSGRVCGPFGEHHFDVVCRKHLQRACKSRFGQCMRVDAQEERPVNFLQLAVVANCLGNGEDVPFVERSLE